MRVMVVGAGQSGMVLAHSLLKAGVDVSVMTGRSSMDLRQGRAQVTQLSLPASRAVEARYNLSMWDSQAPSLETVSLSVYPGQGQDPVGFAGALPGAGYALDPRVKLADWLEYFEDLGGKVMVHNATYSDLVGFSRMYDLVLLAVGDGDLGHVLTPRHAPEHKRRRVVTQAYVHDLEAPTEQVQVHSLPSGEVFVVPTLTARGPCHSVMLIARPGQGLDAQVLGARSARPVRLVQTMVELLRGQGLELAEKLARAELVDEMSTVVKELAPMVRKPVHTTESGGSILGVGDTVLTVPPQCGQGWEASVRSAQVYHEQILAHQDRLDDPQALEGIFGHYMDHGGGHAIDSFEGYVDRHWTGELTPVESNLFARACTEPEVAQAYVAGFADPEQMQRMLTT